MKERGISQSALCSELGVFTSNFNAWLKGSRTLPYGTLVRILEELQLSVGPVGTGASYLPASDMSEIVAMHLSNSGYKTKDVAENTGIDASGLSSFLTGKRKVSSANLEKIMEYTGLGVVKYLQVQNA